jgi:glycosyltransferase involved in cell wall biosynthesis
MRRQACLLVPGRLDTPTGGYRYDRRLTAELERAGWQVDVHELDASFPQPDAAALIDAGRVLASLPSGAAVIIDGLAYGAMPELAAEFARRLPLIALVHHPLAAETGLSAEMAARFEASERAALAAASHVIVTSGTTARRLADYGVSAERISVIEPGTDRVDRARRAPAGPIELLCVATLVPRKGHATLLEALGGLADRDWTLTCVGSDRRDPITAQALHQRAIALGLADRVTFTGEVDDAELERHYAQADLFVLATHDEGYGMALAEAIAHGLPIVSTTAGAVPATVPADVALLVPPGDVAALRDALARVIAQPELRAQLAAAASAASDRLPSWEQSGARLAAVLESVRVR